MGILAIILYFTFTKRDVIANTVNEKKQTNEDKGLVVQSLITLTLFIIVGLSAYFWQRGQLQKEIVQQPISSRLFNTILPVSVLEDLSEFKKITQDTKDIVVANNIEGGHNQSC